jgi:chromosomal replication initiator protein
VANDVLEVWNQAVSYLNQRNTKEYSQIGVFLDYLTPEILSESELVVSTDNSFVKERIERYYSPDIKDAIFNVAGIDYGFRVVFAGKNSPQKTTYRQTSFQPSELGIAATAQAPAQANIPSVEGIATSGITSSIPSYLTTALKPETTSQAKKQESSFVLTPERLAPERERPLTDAPFELTGERDFESFVVGDSNRYAFSAALGVAKSPGNIYNPLFIYGESGLGKTHLLLAIENYIRSHHPHLKTTYAQTSDFVRDFTTMLYDGKKRQEFELKYHRVDVILFDDVQSLEGKFETTNEVFQIFNEFTAQNKQIVLSADRAPKDIDLDERYKSRFARGVTVDIRPPTFETKYAIFENYFDYCCRKIARADIKEIVNREITERIIELSTDNIRELEGATASLVAYLSVRENMFDTLTIAEVERCILNVFMKSEEKRITIESIQKEIETFYQVSHEDLLGQQRSQGISYPRQVAMYLSRSMTGKSYPDIGKAFGGKDHATAMYAYNQIEKKRQLSKETDREIERIIAALKK